MLEINRECTGCMACLNACPAGVINLEKDEYGFAVPQISTELCVECGKCEAVCPLLKEQGQKQKIKPAAAYCMYSRDEEVVKKSSSGGAFYTLAERVLEQGGIVYGCCYDESIKSAYLTDTDHVELDKLLTSKYVESYIGDKLKAVKRQLQTGRQVLFCGTPCQCAGLKSFLDMEYDNLLLVDFTCGAVTAQRPLSDYLESLEKRFGAPVTKLNFRDKRYGWGQYCMAVDFKNGKKYRRTAMSDPYFFCFLRSSMQRLSCHGCRFSHRHVTDIVLADFWKCDSFQTDMKNGRKGLSLVLAMTKKGEQAIAGISDMVYMDALDADEVSYNLKVRECPEGKLEEIRRDQMWAKKRGVKSLRRKLLPLNKRIYYAVRQLIMEHDSLRKKFPKIVGNGQIMKK